jgi:hypothetical protein
MKGDKYRHGGPYDRGRADSYYRRPFDPHYYAENSYSSERIEVSEGSEEYAQYKEGYIDNEKNGVYKNWE